MVEGHNIISIREDLMNSYREYVNFSLYQIYIKLFFIS